jgi:hypothetical protein
MKRLYWLVGLVAAGLVAALFIVPRFVDWNAWKPDIESQASAFLDVPVSIAGNVSVDFLPTPRLTANKVTLGDPNMPAAEIRWARAALNLRALIKGAVELSQVDLVEPDINLNRLIDSFGIGPVVDGGPGDGGVGTQGPAPTSFLGGGAERAAIPFDIENGIVRGMPINGLAVRLDAVDGTLAVRPLSRSGMGEVTFGGAFTLAKRRLQGGVRLQPREDGLRLAVELASADMRADTRSGGQDTASTLTFSGRTTAEAPQRLAGDLRLRAGRLTALPWLPPAVLAAVEDYAPGELILEGRVTADWKTATLSLEEASASTDSLRGTGEVSLSLSGRPRLMVGLSLASLDLTRVADDGPAGPGADRGDFISETNLLEGQVGEGAGPPDPVALDGAGNDPQAWSFQRPQDFPQALAAALEDLHRNLVLRVAAVAGVANAFDGLATTIDLSADTVRLSDGIVRKASLRASADAGELLIERARALLPGGTDLSLFGFVATDPQAPRFEGEIALQSDDARRILSWVGLEDEGWVQRLPRDRLRSFRLSASAVLDRDGLRIGDLLADIDAATLSGSALLDAGGEGPSLSIDLEGDTLNLDVYRAPEAFDPGGTGSTDALRDGASESMVSTQTNIGAGAQSAEARLFTQASQWSGALAQAPLELDLDIGRLVYRGVSYDGVRGTLGSRSGERRATLSVDRVGALGLRAGLRFPDDEPRVDWRLALRAEAPDLGASAAAFGADPSLTQRARKIGTAFVRATIDGNGAGLGFRADGGAGGDALGGSPADFASIGGVISPGSGAKGGLSVQISQGALKLGALRLDSVQMVAALPTAFDDQAQVIIESARAALFGGTVDLAGSLAPGRVGGLDFDARGRLSDLDLADLIGDLGPLLRVVGTAGIEGEFSAKGLTLDQALTTLTGTGQLTGRAGVGLQDQANAQAAGLAQIERLGRRLNSHFGAGDAQGGSDVKGELAGAVQFDRGQLRLRDLTLDGQGAKARGAVELDWRRGRVEGALRVRETGGAKPYLEIEARGPIEGPDVRTGGSWISGE